MVLADGPLVRVPVGLTLERGTPITFWLLQPPASELSHDAPYHHGPDSPTRPLDLLRAAIAADARQQPSGPVFFVMPELTLCGSTLSEVKALGSLIPHNRALILGCGHLRQDECELLEKNTGNEPSLWTRPWSPTRFANAAAIITTGESHLEAKSFASSYEYDRECHLAHRRVRIYQAHGFSFAVVICSELLTVAPGTFLQKLSQHNVDILFWLQHNPHPRHTDFSPALGALYQFTGDQRLVVSLNKQPDPGKRSPYGVTCVYVPAASFGSKKDRFLRANYATEPLAQDTHEVSRAVFVRYDVAAHQLQTVLPSQIPAGDAPGPFMSELTAYVYEAGQLAVSDEPEHYNALFAEGELAAWQQASVDGEQQNEISAQLAKVKSTFFRSPSLLLNFLDTALLSSKSSKHPNHLPHSPPARCDCWPHRVNFDSLYDGEMPGVVAELLIAIAAMMTFSGDVSPNEQCVRDAANLLVGDNKVVLTSANLLLHKFVEQYFGNRQATMLPVVIALRSERNTRLPKSAGRHRVVGRLNAARVERPVPATISGSEFWQSVRDRTLLDRIATSMERAS